MVGKPAFKHGIVSLRFAQVSLNIPDLFGAAHAGSAAGKGRVAQHRQIRAAADLPASRPRVATRFPQAAIHNYELRTQRKSLRYMV